LEKENLINLDVLSWKSLSGNKFILEMITFTKEGRYPEYLPVVPAQNTAEDFLNKTKLLHQWLRERL